MTAAVEERPLTEASTPAEAEKTKTVPPMKVEDEYATFEDLLNKPARERDLNVTIGDKTLKIHLRAIGHHEYDQLTASCPPTADDREKMQPFNLDAFAPKLIAACVTRPKMDLDRASRLWKDPNWAGGEVGGLYQACVRLCQTGLDVPFNGGG